MRRPLAILALSAALIAACGDDDEETRTATVSGGRAVRVVADEYSFDPGAVVYRAGGARTRLTVSLENRGSLAHNLRLFDGDKELGGTPTFPGGRTESASVELEPGRYRMICTVGDHEQLGMHGTLEVR